MFDSHPLSTQFAAQLDIIAQRLSALVDPQARATQIDPCDTAALAVLLSDPPPSAELVWRMTEIRKLLFHLRGGRKRKPSSVSKIDDHLAGARKVVGLPPGGRA